MLTWSVPKTDYGKMRNLLDRWDVVAGCAVVLTVGITLTARGFSHQDIGIACGIAAAATTIAFASLALANRVLPPRDKMTWWQWWRAMWFVPRMLGLAATATALSIATLASGDYDIAIGSAAAIPVLLTIVWLYVRWVYRRSL